MTEQLPPLTVLITRHGKKEKIEGVVPATNEDRFTDLTEQGKKDCFEAGRKVISPNHDHIYVAVSDFVRARRTSEKMLEGAGYDINDEGRVLVLERAGIGHCGYDFFAPEMPDPYTETEDHCVAVMLKDFYRPREGRPELLSMARFAYAMLDTLVKGVEAEMEMQNKAGLVQITTHSPVIDALANPLYGSLVVHKDGMHELRDYPGFFEMGEHITGRALDRTANPVLEFRVKDRDVKHSLSSLKRMRDTHYEASQKAA